MTGDFPGLILVITNNYFSHVQPVYAVGHGTFSVGMFFAELLIMRNR